MNVLSLFTGVGGIDLGLERAGVNIVGQCEADPAARRILERHWPDVPCHRDVRHIGADWLERLECVRGSRADAGPDSGAHSGINLVAGGFPCQDLSVAGKRAGLDGERSGLFFEAARIADLVLGPGGWLLIENVPGLLSSNGGRDFGIVLSTLADLGFHDLAWRTLDSRYFGVPQRRRRVFIVARRSRGDCAKQVLLEPESGGGNFAPGRKAGAGAAGALEPGAKGSIAPTLRANGSKDRNGKAGNRNDQHPIVMANALDRQSGGPDDNSAQANHLAVVSDAEGAAGGQLIPETAFSLDRQAGASSQAHSTNFVTAPGVRRLTPLECERLQAFPDGWTIPDPDLDPGNPYPKPDGPRYAQMGNAVTVPVAEWIGRRIMGVEA